MTTILIVDDSAVDRAVMGKLLGPRWMIQQAANGVEALAQIRENLPDLVITDLQMPQMDGLELVTSIRRDHPSVPVVLVTAHGSESLAVEALDRGAASYVPKPQLADKLLNTVEKVLELAQADRTYEDLINCLTRTEFTFSLALNAALIDPLVDLVQQMVGGVWLCDTTEKRRIGMALKEALLNALFHGSLEIHPRQMQQVLDQVRSGKKVDLIKDPRSEPRFRDRRIFTDVQLSTDEIRFVVRDEGPGFDVRAVPKSHDPEALEPGRGRGLAIMRNLMDEVVFNESGNEVTMVKRRPAAPSS
jgi:CheY-like chemotaxis protein